MLAQGQNGPSLWLDPCGKLNRDAQYTGRLLDNTGQKEKYQYR